MDTIGRYEILSRIGSGGFATVYQARDPVLDSEVAVKVLADNWAGTPEVRDRFIREAQILRRIDSDRVITVHDIGESARGQPYFVMALADRGTLEGRLESGPPAGPADAMTVARGMATCITVVHSHGLIHRDIKPSNLLIAGPRLSPTAPAEARAGVLAPNERLVLGDFGLAKDIELHTTGITIAAGSGGYAAPEQMALAGTPSRRTDLFAATGVMYRVLTGGRPPSFDLEHRVVPFPDGVWWMAGPLGAFFRQGMSYEPDGRHDSIDHWLASFTAALAPFEAPSGQPAHPAPVPPAPPARPGWSGPDPSTDPTTRLPLARTAETRVPSGPLAATARHEPSFLHAPPPTTPTGASAPAQPAPSPYGPAPSPYGPAPSPYGPSPSPQGPVPSTGSYASSSGPPSALVAEEAPHRSRRWFLGGLVAVAGGAAASGWYVLRGDGPVIAGPDTIEAGRSATYSATLGGATSFEWTDPNGVAQPVPALQVNAVIPGTIRISVVGITATGRSAAATRSIEVVAAPNGPVIDGPDTVPVGQTATYGIVYDTPWSNPVWFDPDGRTSEGEQYQVTPKSPGRYLIRLQLDRPGATRIGAAREITLT